ncbi:MAG: MBL fold metallo-hydrolase [Gammaproteobacteria bacterium]|nr:MBL fold metallo-hydrolase [Gammaproteobacteria bacterium]
MHETNDESAAARSALSYPLTAVPDPGDAVSVAPGIMWLRMPLPFSGLNHINVWALEDGTGWTLTDTGMQTADTATYWQQALAGALGRRPVTRVICTHMHPDHIGMAGWLTRQHDCRLWTTRLEYLTCRVLVADTGREAPPDGLRFYHAAGWNEDALAAYKARFGGFGKAVYALPDSYRRIVDGEQIIIGERSWQAVIGRGHSPEHLCLHCPELRVLISGDQVLPRITSNVSVFPTEPDANPLQEWLESLASIAQRVPDDVLVLPSHNEPFRGLHARLTTLIDGHEQRLARMHEELASPKRAADVFGVLFRRRVAADMLIMATGESVAHLNCLLARGLAVRELDDAGVAWYRRA